MVLKNKRYPSTIKKEVEKALSYFPELSETYIQFRFKKNIKKSTMQAQPVWTSFFKPKEEREYQILISEKIQIEEEEFTVNNIPKDVLIGWLGHELGHVMDYRNRSSFGMLLFGFKYLYSKKYMKKAERTADTFALNHGMGHYILRTKNFILDHASMSEKYKNRIRKMYMSPEEVMELLNKAAS